MGADAMIFVFWMLSFSHVQFFPTPWTVVHQTPVSMELSRQEYWNGSHSLLQGIFLIQGSNLSLPHCMQILYHLSHEIYVYIYIYMKWSEVTQSCPTFWDPVDCSLLRSSIPGILQTRTLEWVAISFSNAGKWKVKVKVKSCPTFQTPWTAAYQAPPSMGVSRQEYWSGVPSPFPIYVYIYTYTYIYINPFQKQSSRGL